MTEFTVFNQRRQYTESIKFKTVFLCILCVLPIFIVMLHICE